MTKRNIALIIICCVFFDWLGTASAVLATAERRAAGDDARRPFSAGYDTLSSDTAPISPASPDPPLQPIIHEDQQIPEVFVRIPAGSGAATAVVVEKSSQTLMLFDMQPSPVEIFRIRCSTGKNYGPKTLSGDAKTPEGVYFFTQEFDDKHLTPIYGVKAFTTDYPNLLDRMAQRTGSAIWLHGTDKPLTPYDSNGCIAAENADLLALSPFIEVNRTPVIIVEKLHYPAPGTHRTPAVAIEALLERWHLAVEATDCEDLIAIYGAAKHPPSWWHAWEHRLEQMRRQHGPVRLQTRNLFVYRHRTAFVAVCDQYLEAAGQRLWVGTKKFFLEAQEGGLVVLGDTYQTTSPATRAYPEENPLVAVSRSLDNSLDSAPGNALAGISSEGKAVE